MIIILIGYGEEKEIYPLCRHVWEMYLRTANTEGFLPIFVKTTTCSSDATFHFDGRELTINMRHCLGEDFFMDKGVPQDNLVASDWAPKDNIFHSEKDRISFQWIQNYFGGNCSHVYATTVTSLTEFDALRWLINNLPKEKLFAGTPGQIQNFMGKEKFVFISGANTLISRDLFPLIAKRSSLDRSTLPNDVLRSIKVAGVKKIFFPRKDFSPNEHLQKTSLEAGNLISQAFEEGYFHFRVKSKDDRVAGDHLFLFDIYRAIHKGKRVNLKALAGNLFAER